MFDLTREFSLLARRVDSNRTEPNAELTLPRRARQKPAPPDRLSLSDFGMRPQTHYYESCEQLGV